MSLANLSGELMLKVLGYLSSRRDIASWIAVNEAFASLYSSHRLFLEAFCRERHGVDLNLPRNEFSAVVTLGQTHPASNFLLESFWVYHLPERSDAEQMCRFITSTQHHKGHVKFKALTLEAYCGYVGIEDFVQHEDWTISLIFLYQEESRRNMLFRILAEAHRALLDRATSSSGSRTWGKIIAGFYKHHGHHDSARQIEKDMAEILSNEDHDEGCERRLMKC